MQKHVIPRSVLLLLLLIFALTEANTKALALTDVPPAVQKTIGDNSAGRTVSTIKRADDNGDVSYEVSTLAQDGTEWDLTVADNGTLLGMEVNLSELPPEVQTPINSLVGKGKLEGIDKTFGSDGITYEATMTTPAGEERNFTLAESGTLLSEEVSLAELPPAVQTTIKDQAAQGKLAGIDETFDDAGIAYEATVTAPDGQDHNVTVGPNGKLLSLEVRLAELSPAVQTAINTEVGQGKLEGIDQNFGPAGHTYEGDMTTPDGQEREFVVSAQGVLLSHEVSLEDVPSAAQNTITKTIGDGTILKINQIFMIVKHTVRYSVEGEKDGKTFDFNVGPKGKVLVTEDQ